jgi:hypothetical protein
MSMCGVARRKALRIRVGEEGRLPGDQQPAAGRGARGSGLRRAQRPPGAHACVDMAALQVGDQSVEVAAIGTCRLSHEAVRRGALTVVYSPLLRAIATDLESKLSEGALLHIRNWPILRSYAHGRHLWLAQRPQECAILALVEPSLDRLWEGMRGKFPADIPDANHALGGR